MKTKGKSMVYVWLQVPYLVYRSAHTSDAVSIYGPSKQRTAGVKQFFSNSKHNVSLIFALDIFSTGIVEAN